MKIEQIEKLSSWEEHREALKNATLRGDKPIECNCIPYEEWKLRKEVKITVSTVYPAKPENFHEYPVIMVFNEKLKTWQAEPLVEYKDVCPVCLKLLLVRAIAGTSWLACCSKECYEKYNQVKLQREKRRKMIPAPNKDKQIAKDYLEITGSSKKDAEKASKELFPDNIPTYSCINCGFGHYNIFEVIDEETGKCKNCQISAIEIKKIVASEKMVKTCVICGKEHNREYTCSDKCHELFKQKLVKELGEYKIVVDLATGKEHRVPIVDIFEKGIKQEDLKNYPIITVAVLRVNEIKSFDDTFSVRLKEDGRLEIIEYGYDGTCDLAGIGESDKEPLKRIL